MIIGTTDPVPGYEVMRNNNQPYSSAKIRIQVIEVYCVSSSHLDSMTSGISLLNTQMLKSKVVNKIILTHRSNRTISSTKYNYAGKRMGNFSTEAYKLGTVRHKMEIRFVGPLELEGNSLLE